MPKEPHPTDMQVGLRIREARLSTGLSQEKLAKHLGVTFQQLQKYENGRNRISPSKLQVIARVVQMPPAWFFDGQGAHPTMDDGTRELRSFAISREGLELNRAFARLTDPRMRRRILALVKHLADHYREPNKKPN